MDRSQKRGFSFHKLDSAGRRRTDCLRRESHSVCQKNKHSVRDFKIQGLTSLNHYRFGCLLHCQLEEFQHRNVLEGYTESVHKENRSNNLLAGRPILAGVYSNPSSSHIVGNAVLECVSWWGVKMFQVKLDKFGRYVLALRMWSVTKGEALSLLYQQNNPHTMLKIGALGWIGLFIQS